jgi:hypothetical protein
LNEDIVQSLCFHADIELLDAKAHSSYKLFHGAYYEVQPRVNKPRKLAPLLHYAHFGSRDGKEARDAHC